MMQTGGSIALVSSAAARIGLANHEAIAAAKGGINGLVLSAAATYAPRGIRRQRRRAGARPHSAHPTHHWPMRPRSRASIALCMRSVESVSLKRSLRASPGSSDPAQQRVTGQILRN
jgi:NAD(P)-dependent dehydrogenase (short-subunit alcohol dehydrogenase family)